MKSQVICGSVHPNNGCRGERYPPLCHPEEPACLWQVKGAMTLPPAPATKVGVPHSSPVLGLSGIRSTPVFGLSLGAKPRDLQFSGPLVEMFFDRSLA